MNADPAVMEHFPSTLTRADTERLVRHIEQGFEERGYGLWALEVVGGAPFIGFVGLNLTTWEAPFTPAVEVGWRLGAEHWGRGYATEAAREAVRFGFEVLGLDEIVSFTVPANVRSRRVMERLGMTLDPGGDFENPNVPEGSHLRHHVLYRLARPERK